MHTDLARHGRYIFAQRNSDLPFSSLPQIESCNPEIWPSSTVFNVRAAVLAGEKSYRSPQEHHRGPKTYELDCPVRTRHTAENPKGIMAI